MTTHADIPANFGDIGMLNALAEILERLGESLAAEADEMPDPYVYSLTPSAMAEWLHELRLYLTETGLTIDQLRERVWPSSGFSFRLRLPIVIEQDGACGTE